jgi:hypothetical protein
MSTWSIDAPGVAAVLQNVQTASEELVTAFDSMNSAQSILSAASGGILAPAASATVDLIESQKSRFDNISARIQACGLGAGQATMAYVHGDEEMATLTQSAAIDAASTGNLSFFDGAQ